MDITLLIRGLVIGFSIAAPVGPIGLLCIRRTLAGGRVVGLVSGLGAATADAFYGCIAGFGITAVSGLLLDYQGWIRLIGGLFLCYLGVKTFAAAPAERAASVAASTLIRAYTSTLVLTLSNPTTILSFAAIFAGLGAGTARGDYGAAILIVLGVFLGSAAWWLLLSSGAGALRARVTPTMLVWVNRLSGSLIFAVGLLALMSL